MIKKLALSLLAVIFTLVSLEISARIYDKFKELNLDAHVYGSKIYQDSKFLDFSFKPNTAQYIRPYKEYYRINSLGFRGKEFDIKKPKNGFRIICMGASTTQSGDYPDKLQKILSEEYPKRNIEVINAAVLAWGTTQNLINYIIRLTYLDANLIIPYFCNHQEDIRKYGYLYDLPQPQMRKSGLRRYSVLYNIFYNRIKDFQIYRKEKQWEKSLRQNFRKKTTEYKKAAQKATFSPNTYEMNLENLIILARGRGSKILLCTFATSFKPDMECDEYLHLRFPYANAYFQQRMVDTNNAVVKRLASDYNLPLSDIANKMPKDFECFFDFMHFTQTGAERLAEILAEDIRRYKLIE